MKTFRFRLISQQSGDNDLPSNRNTQLDEQLPLGLSFHQQMANTTSNNIPTTPNNPQQQASSLNVPKVIGNVDRATFRQQPPPMKVVRLNSMK
jgi:hypothetical protein